MSTKNKLEAQNPLMLRCHRLMEAFTKSDDERDFYLDRQEGFIIYVDLDKPDQDLLLLEEELKTHSERYVLIPKLTFYETKKIMEGFVNEKVYDIDTKEKLLDIIQSKEARENFLEFIYDHHAELEKWQQYYQERSRIRIIEWLRNNHFHFVFEEDLDFPKNLLEKLKKNLFQTKIGKDIAAARKTLVSKAKTYYSTEALNPRPKRGRPPKQAVKQEVEPQFTLDIYTTVPPSLHQFLFTPDISSASMVTFSSKFENEEQLLASRRHHPSAPDMDLSLESLNQKLAKLRSLSSRWIEPTTKSSANPPPLVEDETEETEDFLEEESEDDETDSLNGFHSLPSPKEKQREFTPKSSATKTYSKSTSKSKAEPKKVAKRILPNSKGFSEKSVKSKSKSTKVPSKSKKK